MIDISFLFPPPIVKSPYIADENLITINAFISWSSPFPISKRSLRRYIYQQLSAIADYIFRTAPCMSEHECTLPNISVQFGS